MLTREQVLRDLPERVERRPAAVAAESELLYCRRCRGVRLFRRRDPSVFTKVFLFVLLPIWLFFLVRARMRCTDCGRSGGRGFG
ncbi:MAG: hypothetical protein JJU33_01900 [Phycisphaerales bacterium]|nr:hypothetical protein [Phycisphaerales bacterium]